MPRSGWRLMRYTGTTISTPAKTKSFQPMRPSNFWKYQASISGSAIFMSSDGWKRATPRLSQRRDPLTTTPNSATPISISTRGDIERHRDARERLRRDVRGNPHQHHREAQRSRAGS